MYTNLNINRLCDYVSHKSMSAPGSNPVTDHSARRPEMFETSERHTSVPYTRNPRFTTTMDQ